MLQRAASNACSWWVASYIRTKQSKWLENSMMDMEDRVQCMLKLIEQDGDSFARRAEMYYKKRPELISAVEDSFKAFKALADRYDMLSKELQTANKTIGTVFPEQVQFSIDDDEDDPPNIIPRKPQNPLANAVKVPEAPNPKAGLEKLKSMVKPKPQFQANTLSKTTSQRQNKPVVKSGLSKEEAVGEINKAQKEILALQTVKEFVKSSYETGLAKYWEIENEITEMQVKASRLQDEFDVEAVIEDNEARALMAETALKSCQQTLATLQQKQVKSTEEASEELKKIVLARELLKSIKHECLKDQGEEDKTMKAGDESRFLEKDRITLMQESRGNYDTGKGLDLGSVECLTVSELAENVDELVNKVVTLETAVSTQTALINTLRIEANVLHAQIRNLENNKKTLNSNSQNFRAQVKEMEEKITRLDNLYNNVETRNSNLQTGFAEACSRLGHLSEKLSNVRPDEDVTDFPSLEDETKTPSEENKHQNKNVESRGDTKKTKNKTKKTSKTKKTNKTEKTEKVKDVDVDVRGGSSKPPVPKQPVRRLVSVLKKAEENAGDEGIGAEILKDLEGENLKWEEILLSGSDAEKALLQEYSKVLKDYKEVKRKLRESEKKERESEFESTVQIKELKDTIAKKEQEIQALHQKLALLQDEKEREDGGALRSNVSQDRSAKPKPENEEFLEVKEEINTKDSTNIPNKHEEDKELQDETIGSSVVEEVKEEINTKDNNDIPNKHKEDKELQDETIGSSVVEEKFREDFDAILDENLNFWLRFSTSFNQVQKFKSVVQDLKNDISKLRDKNQTEGCLTAELKSEARPHYKHLREIETELALCMQQNSSLKDELKERYNSFSSMQEEITKVLKEAVVEGEAIVFSSHQAAKLQGELQNMKHENSKLRKELQAGINELALVQVEIEKTLRVLSEEFGITSHIPPLQLHQCLTKARVPLRSFLFGTKPKKKQSFLSYMQAQANRKFSPVVRTGRPMAITNR